MLVRMYTCACYPYPLLVVYVMDLVLLLEKNKDYGSSLLPYPVFILKGPLSAHRKFTGGQIVARDLCWLENIWSGTLSQRVCLKSILGTLIDAAGTRLEYILILQRYTNGKVREERSAQ